jgi:hypothetical protein
MVKIYVWHDDGSLTEPKHVTTLDATLKSVVLDGYFRTIYCDVLEHNGMVNIKNNTLTYVLFSP